MTNEDRTAIQKLLDDFALGWRTMDAVRLKSAWDAEYADASCVASERDACLWGFAAISHYYEEATAMFPITSMDIHNIRIVPADGVAFAFCDISIGFILNGQEMVVHPRATFVLRKRAGAWRILHYHESIQWQLPA